MAVKGELDIDPRGLIFEAYRIEAISAPECRVIFLDWAMSSSQDRAMPAMLAELLAHYGPANPDHPMTRLIAEGMSRSVTPKRRRRPGGSGDDRIV